MNPCYRERGKEFLQAKQTREQGRRVGQELPGDEKEGRMTRSPSGLRGGGEWCDSAEKSEKTLRYAQGELRSSGLCRARPDAQGRPHAVALRFVRRDQLTVGLPPTRVRPCRAHKKTPNGNSVRGFLYATTGDVQRISNRKPSATAERSASCGSSCRLPTWSCWRFCRRKPAR